MRNIFKSSLKSNTDRDTTVHVKLKNALNNAKEIVELIEDVADIVNEIDTEKAVKAFGKIFDNGRKRFEDDDDDLVIDRKRSSPRNLDINPTKNRKILQYDVEDIQNLKDVLNYIKAKTGAPITYGTSSGKMLFAISSNIFITANPFSKKDFNIHFSMDPENFVVKKSSVDRVIESFEKLVTFMASMIKFVSDDGSIKAVFEDESLLLVLDEETKISAGVVILIIKALKSDEADEGYEFKISDLTCKVKRDNLIISKAGFTPALIPIKVFEYLYKNMDIFNTTDFNDKAWTQYSASPEALTIRMVLELMDANDEDMISTNDIKVIDSFDCFLKTSVLGEELKNFEKGKE